MTIRPREPWGDLGPVPADVVRPDSDARIAAAVGAALEAGGPPCDVAPLGGDLFRSIGGHAGVDRILAGGDVARLPCDVLEVALDDRRTVYAVAHVVIRRPWLGSPSFGWWRGRSIALMNAQHIGRWDVAPRSHPNDGRVDVLEVDAAMGLRERWKARRRLELGAHLPHPAIRTRQARSATFDLLPGERVWLDGVDHGRCSRVAVTVVPDAFVAYV